MFGSPSNALPRPFRFQFTNRKVRHKIRQIRKISSQIHNTAWDPVP
jgi:hypothetical protein